jgi:hypothetical protein
LVLGQPGVASISKTDPLEHSIRKFGSLNWLSKTI